MVLTTSTIITIASLITALTVIASAVFKTHKWFLRQEQQEIEIKHLKHEQRIICTGVLACLDGLEQLGCNHTTQSAKAKLEEHLNEVAHE